MVRRLKIVAVVLAINYAISLLLMHVSSQPIWIYYLVSSLLLWRILDAVVAVKHSKPFFIPTSIYRILCEDSKESKSGHYLISKYLDEIKSKNNSKYSKWATDIVNRGVCYERELIAIAIWNEKTKLNLLA